MHLDLVHERGRVVRRQPHRIGIAKHADHTVEMTVHARARRHGRQHVLDAGQAELDTARKLGVLQQKAQRMLAADALADVAPVHLIGGQRAQHRHPLHVAEGLAIFLAARGDQARGAGIDDAGGHVGLLDAGAQAQELVADVAAHIGRQQAGDLQAAIDHPGDEFQPVAPLQGALAAATQVQVQIVDRFPHLLRQGVADAAQDLARTADGNRQRGRVLLVQQQKAHHLGIGHVGAGIRMQRGEYLARANRVDHRPPAEAHRARQVQLQHAADPDQARGVFRAADVAAEPVQIVCHPREHQCVPWSSASTTQVSLAPPPCEELTTSEPGVIATRVSPPVVT